jgi:uncharacterized coiled-coil protein SlyX
MINGKLMDLLQKYRKTINNLNNQINQKERIIKKLSVLADNATTPLQKEIAKQKDTIKRLSEQNSEKEKIIESLKKTIATFETDTEKSKKPVSKRRTRKTKDATE